MSPLGEIAFASVGFLLACVAAVAAAAINALDIPTLRAVRAETNLRDQASALLKGRDWLYAAYSVFSFLLTYAGGALLLYRYNFERYWQVGILVAIVVHATLIGWARVWCLRADPRLLFSFLRWSQPLALLSLPFIFPAYVTIRVAKGTIEDSSADEDLASRMVEELISLNEEQGTIAADEATMLKSVFEFGHTLTREVMVPRMDVVAFDITAPVDDIMATVADNLHSRFPVYRGTMDQVVGVLYAKDMFRMVHRQSNPATVGEAMRRPVLVVREEDPIRVVLKLMQANRFHLGVVVDEFGGTAGIVTLEDILEEIVGDIQDEHDEGGEATLEIRTLGEHHWVCEGKTLLYDLCAAIPDFPASTSTDYDSVGGLLTHLVGDLPSEGASSEYAGFRLKVLEATERRVIRVELKRLETDGEKMSSAV